MSDALFDAELCGNGRGAFTRATEDRPGYLGLAEGGGTLVFDELGDIDGAIQGKLLHPVENRVYRRVGDSEMRPFLGRFVFSTNKELAALVRRGKFREELYCAKRPTSGGSTCTASDGWAYRIEADIARRKGGHAWCGKPARAAERRAELRPVEPSGVRGEGMARRIPGRSRGAWWRAATGGGRGAGAGGGARAGGGAKAMRRRGSGCWGRMRLQAGCRWTIGTGTS